MNEIAFLEVQDLVSLVHAKELSPVEISEYFLARIEEHDGSVNAFSTVDRADVLAQAKRSEQAQMTGELGELHGIPIGIKDLIFTKGLRTTGGSRMYADLVPTQDDVVVERLRAAGAIILGKTNTAEFGFSANQTDNELFGATRNPWDLSTSPGGSSGGSAAAVAAGLCPIAVGSDGGGSVRIPSSFCGLFGLKPTFGRIPLFPGCRDPQFPGLSAWESLEHIGPIARSVADAALLADVMSGPDHRDRHSAHYGTPTRLSGLPRLDNLTGLTIAWSADWDGAELVDPGVTDAFTAAVDRLVELGATVVNDSPDRAVAREHFAALAALDADPPAFRKAMEGYEESVADRVQQMLNREWTFGELAAAVTRKKAMYLGFTEFFDRYDAFVTPTVPFTAMPLGQEGPDRIAGQKLEVPARAVIGFCYPFNVTGHPAASIPCGSSADGLPIGMQIVSKWHRDDVVVQIAATYERAPAHPRQFVPSTRA
jgi:aspartyl-tRNA(Asn)/glutamyl-tRNA(Gln) amidotransferase subunit A